MNRSLDMKTIVQQNYSVTTNFINDKYLTEKASLQFLKCCDTVRNKRRICRGEGGGALQYFECD